METQSVEISVHSREDVCKPSFDRHMRSELLCPDHVQVFWPDDGAWWPGTVTALNMKQLQMTLLYDTGRGIAQTLDFSGG